MSGVLCSARVLDCCLCTRGYGTLPAPCFSGLRPKFFIRPTGVALIKRLSSKRYTWSTSDQTEHEDLSLLSGVDTCQDLLANTCVHQ